MNWNPKTWFKAKPSGEAVYVSIWLDKPFQGLFLEPPKGAWIKVKGLDLAVAAQILPGRSINWHTVPTSIRAQLEIDFKGFEMDWEQLKEWVI